MPSQPIIRLRQPTRGSSAGCFLPALMLMLLAGGVAVWYFKAYPSSWRRSATEGQEVSDPAKLSPNKRMTITGRIETGGVDMEMAIAALRGKEPVPVEHPYSLQLSWKGHTAMCLFRSNNGFLNVGIGQEVTISGRYKWHTGELIFLEDCELVSPKPD